MSIFKIKQWWSNNKFVDETNDTQNLCCLKIDKFSSHSDSDCIIASEDNLLRIYKPTDDVSHTILEHEFSDMILQIETGKFMVGSDDRQILVLLPQRYEIYQLKRKEGHTDAGDQNIFIQTLKHTFTRRAYTLCCGSFGNIKSRDFICVQSIDGTLNFFDQDNFLFMCIFNDVIIPGPVTYIPSCDAFVVCKSTWVMEIYSYQQLREFSELSAKQNKNNIPQWIYNAGEEITALQVIQTSNNFSSIIALGERHLCCFQDNGLMKYMIKFDFMPICCYAYLIGWYYEPGARMLLMVSSEDARLYVYENTALLWSCDLIHVATSISRCFLKTLSGGLVTLSKDGLVSVSYLGTEPDLNSNATPILNEAMDPEQLKTQLETVEEALQTIYDKNDGNEDFSIKLEEVLKIKIDIGKPVQNIFEESASGSSNKALHLMMCPIITILSCSNPSVIQNIQITFACNPPFTCSDYTVCLDSVNGTEIIETQIFLSSEYDVSDTKLKTLLTVTTFEGNIGVVTRETVIPLKLYCLLGENTAEHALKLYVQVHQCPDFSDIFRDFHGEEVSKEILSFTQRSTNKTMTLKKLNNQYCIEANDFPELISFVTYIDFMLSEHFSRMNESYPIRLIYDESFVKQMIYKFLKTIETHAKERLKLKQYEDELQILQKQFTLIQKRLLVQYGSLPPGDCDPLEFLMKDTHSRLIDTVNEIILTKEVVCRAGNAMSSVGNLIIFILKHSTSESFKIKLLEEMLSLSSLHEEYYEWEECVTQSLTYIINNVFQKSEKDKEKLTPVSEQDILSQMNLKKFLRQLKILLDKIFSDIQKDNEPIISKEQTITRIEELVEVI